MTTHSSRRSPLSRTQTAVLAAAIDRILPTTDTPGALEAGCLDYIVEALAGDYAAQRPLYRRGVKALDRHATRRFGEGFAVTSGRRRDAVLRDFERNRVKHFPAAPQFFFVLWRHTMEGFLGEPDYGGNRNLIGWKLLGFPGHQLGHGDAATADRTTPVALPGGVPPKPETLP